MRTLPVISILLNHFKYSMTDLNLAAVAGFDNGQLYGDDDALRLMMNEIGVEIRERNKIINDGFNSMDDIVTHYSNDTESFVTYLTSMNKTFANHNDPNQRSYFPPLVLQRFTGVVHYFNISVNLFHTIPDLMSVDSASASNYYRHYKSHTQEVTDESDEIILPTLKGHSNWIDYRDKFMMKLAKGKGARGITLSYVVDETDRHSDNINEDFDAVTTLDINNHEMYVTDTMHFGEGWTDDNRTVWNMLKSSLLGHPPFNHISRFNTGTNGRNAWFALRNFYEGEDFVERNRETAFTTLSNTFYKGETTRFNFEKYIEIHKSAHKMLEDCGYNGGTGMDDATKIQHFKSGIKQDAGLETALTQVRANPTYNTFDMLTAFLSAEVDHKSLRRKQLKGTNERRVASTQGSHNGGKKNNKSNNGNKKSNDQFPSRYVDGKTVYGKSYPNHEYKMLTKSQRQAVIELQRQRRRSKGNNSNNHADNNAAKAYSAEITSLRDDLALLTDAIVSGVSQAQGEDLSVITESAAPPDPNAENPPSPKRKASSGSVGDYIRRMRSRT